MSNRVPVRGQPGNDPNLVTVKVSYDGRIGLFNAAGQTDVVGDFVGYYLN